MTEEIFKPGQEYLVKLWKAVYVNVFSVLKASSRLVSYREEILQIWPQIISLATETQAAASFKEAYKKYHKIFKRQVSQLGSSFAKRV